ncbi:IS701 family transposase, partial [Streptomyces rubradiris]
LEQRGWSYVMAVDPKEIARPAGAEPYQPVYGGLGPPTLPRYREAPRPLPGLVAEAAVFEELRSSGARRVLGFGGSGFAPVSAPRCLPALSCAPDHAGR